MRHLAKFPAMNHGPLGGEAARECASAREGHWRRSRAVSSLTERLAIERPGYRSAALLRGPRASRKAQWLDPVGTRVLVLKPGARSEASASGRAVSVRGPIGGYGVAAGGGCAGLPPRKASTAAHQRPSRLAPISLRSQPFRRLRAVAEVAPITGRNGSSHSFKKSSRCSFACRSVSQLPWSARRSP